MRALGPIGGTLPSPMLVAEAQFPDQNPWTQNNISNVHSTAEKFRPGRTHSARAALECPRVSFAADEVRLIRPINVLNIAAAVATDDHLARLHGGFVLPSSSTSHFPASLSLPCLPLLYLLYPSPTRICRPSYPCVYNFLFFFFFSFANRHIERWRHEESRCHWEFGYGEGGRGEEKISVNWRESDVEMSAGRGVARLPFWERNETVPSAALQRGSYRKRGRVVASGTVCDWWGSDSDGSALDTSLLAPNNAYSSDV